MTKSSKTKIIFLADYYLPGTNAGGPIKSLSNLFGIIEKYFDITLITRNHDFKSKEIYSEDKIRGSNPSKFINTNYLALNLSGYWKIYQIIKSTKSEKIFLNSLFSVPFSIYPLFLFTVGLIKPQEIFLAPRGELAESALAYNGRLKKIYLSLLKNSGVMNRIKWVAASDHELKAINNFTNKTDIIMLPNIGMVPLQNAQFIQAPSLLNELRIIFYSRISPIKNLKFIYEVLKKIDFKITLDLYGPITDSTYWEECIKLQSTLPARVQVNYCNSIDLEKFKTVVQNYHFMFLPTEGENFGQAIYECLACGRPVLISDQTPWRNLQGLQAGYDISLQAPEKFVEAINQIVKFNQNDLNLLISGSLALAKNYQATQVVPEKIIGLFNQ